MRLFVARNPIGALPPGGVALDPFVVATVTGAVGGAAIVFGALPAMRALRAMDPDLIRTRVTTPTRRHLRSRMLFVTVQVALSLMLLVTAGLLISSYQRLTSEPLGFRTGGVYVEGIALPLSKYPTSDVQARFVDDLLPRLDAIPFVRAAASRRGGGPFGRTESRRSKSKAAPQRGPLAFCRSAPYLRCDRCATTGRTGTRRRPSTRRSFSGATQGGPRVDTLTLYLYVQTTSLSASAIAASVRALDPDLPLRAWRPTGEIVDELQAQPKLRASLVGSFAALTLLLAVVGVCGVMMRFVEQQRREIGIRVALGARASNVLRLVPRRTSWLCLVWRLGAVGALGSARLLRNVLYSISPLDPVTLTAAIALLAVVAVGASYGPARRTATIDPNAALRCE